MTTTTTTTDRLENALDAMGCPTPRSVAVLTLEVLDQLEDDVTLTGAHLTAVRGQDYGHPDINFANTWELWQPVLRAPNLTGQQKVALCMTLVKVARLIQSPEHPDSIGDLAGYAATLDLLAGRDPSV